MRVLSLLLSLFAFGAIGLGCSSSSQSAGQIERAGARRSDRISREEIEARHWTDAYELVATLRPTWLSNRGQDSFGSSAVIQVLLNGAQLGGVATLRQVAIADIQYLQYHDGTAATARWGVGFGKGAIELSTTPRR
jgi:hypothetical protein